MQSAVFYNQVSGALVETELNESLGFFFIHTRGSPLILG